MAKKPKREITYLNVDDEDDLVQTIFNEAVKAKANATSAADQAKSLKEVSDDSLAVVLGMIDDETQDTGFTKEGVGVIRWHKKDNPRLDKDKLAQILVAKYEMDPKDVGEAIKEATKNKPIVYPEFRAAKGDA